jgi:hypothetical protein
MIRECGKPIWGRVFRLILPRRTPHPVAFGNIPLPQGERVKTGFILSFYFKSYSLQCLKLSTSSLPLLQTKTTTILQPLSLQRFKHCLLEKGIVCLAPLPAGERPRPARCCCWGKKGCLAQQDGVRGTARLNTIKPSSEPANLLSPTLSNASCGCAQYQIDRGFWH